MKIKRLDHVNIIGPRALVDRVKEFYQRILGFREGFRPAFGIEGVWLYIDNQPLIHLTIAETAVVEATAGVHHFALACTGLDEFVAKLEAEGVRYRVAKVPQLSMTQLFLQDPAGVGVELNFVGE